MWITSGWPTIRPECSDSSALAPNGWIPPLLPLPSVLPQFARQLAYGKVIRVPSSSVVVGGPSGSPLMSKNCNEASP